MIWQAQTAISRPNLRLVVDNGSRATQVATRPAPEAVMDVSFQGLTEAEQRAALQGFPGGKRFRLVSGRN